MKRLLYQIRSIGALNVILYILLYPFRYLNGYLEWSHKIRSEKRSHMTIYKYGPDSLIQKKKLSQVRKNKIKNYYKKYGLSINTRWHNTFYAVNGIDSDRYISEYHFYHFIEPHFNNMSMVRSFADKNLYSHHFSNIAQPKTILRSIHGKLFNESYQRIDKKTAFELIHDLQETVIIKPSVMSGKGRNVNLLKSKNGLIFLNDRSFSFDQIVDFYQSGFIIQEFVNQHEDLSSLYPHSLNTIKVISFRYRDDIHLLSSFFRAGNDGNHIDSVGQGGFLCGIHEDGSLNESAYDMDFREYQQHPTTETAFGSVKIPNFKEVKDSVKNLHSNNFYCDIASWDLGINELGEPVLIETNISSQGIFYHQLLSGPLFGEYTDEILREVFSNSNSKVPSLKGHQL